MIATQYKITLPSDYDMNIIKDRVRNNGHKTDGFEDLKFKLYLVTEKGINNNLQNSYCPLYLLERQQREKSLQKKKPSLVRWAP